MEYVNSLLSREDVLQFMIFTDDSVEIQFKDHTTVQISACGANYQFIKSVDGCPGISDHHNVIRQRCRFATSQTKQKVELGLKLRNLFAARPYIPSQFTNLSDDGVVHLYRDLTSFYWVDDDGCPKMEHASDGSVKISSQKDGATFILSNNGLQCFVNFLAKISPCASRTTTPQQSPREKDDSKGNRRDYIWLKHIFPTQFCPPGWQYPLNKALKVQGKDPAANLENTLDCSHAPRPLPSVCPKQFQHSWRTNQDSFNQNDGELVLPSEKGCQTIPNNWLKILWNNGTLYWINCMKNVGDPGVEVWLPDNTILKSISATKFYFQHFLFCKASGKVDLERTYSPTALPMQPELKTTILRAVRLLSYIEQNKAMAETNKPAACWHDALSLETRFSTGTAINSKTMQPTLDVALPNLGTFSAINGSVQVSFKDGTTVHVAVSDYQYEQLKVSANVLEELPWRLRMTDGTYSTNFNLLHCDASVSKYIKPTCDWVIWLAGSLDERNTKPFYNDTMYASDKMSMVSKELEKINLFNSLEESHSFQSNSQEIDGSSFLDITCNMPSNCSANTKMPEMWTASGTMMPADIARALSNTSRAISDIDNILNTCR